MTGTEIETEVVSPTQLLLNEAQQHELLVLARQAIAHYLQHKRFLTPTPQTDDPQLQQKAGVFVTLRTRWEPTQPHDKAARLRGCIGHVEADEALIDVVPVMAVKAATRDPRFPPVTAVELPKLHIEISVLSALAPVANIHEIELGLHGLVIVNELKRGLLLPQVPVMFGWTQDEYLEGICRKADLRPNAWRSSELFTFTTQVFEEAE
ncbi:MAG: AmmeMemoRadiSam system protein A [Chloroflexota bacterium]